MRNPAHLVVALGVVATSLGAQPAQRLDTVRVTSRVGASDGTRSTSVITRADIDRSSAATVAELLATRLGIDVGARSAAQNDVSIRGASYEQVVILVDGVRVSDIQSGHYNLDLAVPLAAIDRVEIQRGGGSALYGTGAIGGVINIVTRRDRGPAHAAVRGGSFGTVDGSVGSSTAVGSGAIRATAAHARSDGHRDGTDYRITEVASTLTRGRLRLDGGYGRRAFGAADFYGAFPSYETTATATGALRLAETSTRAGRIAAVAHVRHHTDHFILRRADPAFYENRHTGLQYGAEVTTRLVSPGERLATVIGAEVLDARLASARLGDRDEQRYALFGESRVAVGDRASVVAGLRLDHRPGEESFASPSLAASIALAPSVQMRAAIDRGFRSPTWTERYYRDPANIGSADLRSERFWSGEIGLRTGDERRSTDVAVFAREARDLIDWARPFGAAPSVPWRTMNLELATFLGVEAEAAGAIGARGRLAVFGSALALESTSVGALIGKYTLRPLTRTAGLRLELAGPVATTAAVAARHARRPGEAGYQVLDLRVSRAIGDWRIVADGMNLTGASYLDAAARPVAGRAAYLAVERR